MEPSPIVSEQILNLPTYEEIYSLDLTQPTGLTVEQLERGLLKELKQYAWKYIEMEETYGINAVFLASKDAFESGWAVYAYGNNLSGWGHDFPFDSGEKCIEHVSLYVKLWYLTEPHDETECTEDCIEYYINNQCAIGQYYHGTTVGAVNKHYNGRKFWEDEVVGIMAGVYRRIEQDEA